jgi:hypothetical protein
MGCKPPLAKFSAFVQGLVLGLPPGVPNHPEAGLPIPAKIGDTLQVATGGHGAIHPFFPGALVGLHKHQHRVRLAAALPEGHCLPDGPSFQDTL